MHYIDWSHLNHLGYLQWRLLHSNWLKFSDISSVRIIWTGWPHQQRAGSEPVSPDQGGLEVVLVQEEEDISQPDVGLLATSWHLDSRVMAGWKERQDWPEWQHDLRAERTPWCFRPRLLSTGSSWGSPRSRASPWHWANWSCWSARGSAWSVCEPLWSRSRGRWAAPQATPPSPSSWWWEPSPSPCRGVWEHSSRPPPNQTAQGWQHCCTAPSVAGRSRPASPASPPASPRTQWGTRTWWWCSSRAPRLAALPAPRLWPTLCPTATDCCKRCLL